MEISSCPFCGGVKFRMTTHPRGFVENLPAVRCIGCEAEGPSGETEEAAVSLWNDRVPNPPTES